jgi:hypothetical protein
LTALEFHAVASYVKAWVNADIRRGEKKGGARVGGGGGGGGGGASSSGSGSSSSSNLDASVKKRKSQSLQFGLPCAHPEGAQHGSMCVTCPATDSAMENTPLCPPPHSGSGGGGGEDSRRSGSGGSFTLKPPRPLGRTCHSPQ